MVLGRSRWEGMMRISDCWRENVWLFMLELNKAEAAAAMSRRMHRCKDQCILYNLLTQDRPLLKERCRSPG